MNIYRYIFICYAVHLKLTQYCKSTTLQFLKSACLWPPLQTQYFGKPASVTNPMQVILMHIVTYIAD